MAQHPAERRGLILRTYNREVDFSFWPMVRSAGPRPGTQSRVFASEPWNVIAQAVNARCPVNAKAQALAYLEQAKDFYLASKVANSTASKPLLIYYSMMNVVKTFGLTKGIVIDYGNHHHGLAPDFSTGAGPAGVKIKAHPSSPTKVNLFDMLLTEIAGTTNTLRTDYDLERVLPQVLLGHRLWCMAAGQKERFIEIDDIRFRESKTRKEAWIRFDILKTEYGRLGYTQAAVMTGAQLSTSWQIVFGRRSDKAVRLQTKVAKTYTDQASGVLNAVVKQVRTSFWRSITITPPFRKYYVFVGQQGDALLPQPCSIYLLFFYLGAITRYRPQFFDQLTSGPYGAFVMEFIANQPNQWLYMMASEFAEQEITRAAVV